MQTLRGIRALLVFSVVVVLSTYMYCQRATRAVGEPGLCRAVRKHVVAMCTDSRGSIRDEELGRVETIEDLCEMRLSTSHARCMLKAHSLAEVDACTR